MPDGIGGKAMNPKSRFQFHGKKEKNIVTTPFPAKMLPQTNSWNVQKKWLHVEGMDHDGPPTVELRGPRL